MAGAGGAAGPAPEVRHQPPGKTEYISHKFACHNINPASSMVKAAGYSVRGHGFDSPPEQIFLFKNKYKTICFCTSNVRTWYMYDMNKC